MAILKKLDYEITKVDENSPYTLLSGMLSKLEKLNKEQLNFEIFEQIFNDLFSYSRYKGCFKWINTCHINMRKLVSIFLVKTELTDQIFKCISSLLVEIGKHILSNLKNVYSETTTPKNFKISCALLKLFYSNYCFYLSTFKDIIFKSNGIQFFETIMLLTSMEYCLIVTDPSFTALTGCISKHNATLFKNYSSISNWESFILKIIMLSEFKTLTETSPQTFDNEILTLSKLGFLIYISKINQDLFVDTVKLGKMKLADTIFTIISRTSAYIATYFMLPQKNPLIDFMCDLCLEFIRNNVNINNLIVKSLYFYEFIEHTITLTVLRKIFIYLDLKNKNKILEAIVEMPSLFASNEKIVIRSRNSLRLLLINVDLVIKQNLIKILLNFTNLKQIVVWSYFPFDMISETGSNSLEEKCVEIMENIYKLLENNKTSFKIKNICIKCMQNLFRYFSVLKFSEYGQKTIKLIEERTKSHDHIYYTSLKTLIENRYYDQEAIEEISKPSLGSQKISTRTAIFSIDIFQHVNCKKLMSLILDHINKYLKHNKNPFSIVLVYSDILSKRKQVPQKYQLLTSAFESLSLIILNKNKDKSFSIFTHRGLNCLQLTILRLKSLKKSQSKNRKECEELNHFKSYLTKTKTFPDPQKKVLEEIFILIKEKTGK